MKEFLTELNIGFGIPIARLIVFLNKFGQIPTHRSWQEGTIPPELD